MPTPRPVSTRRLRTEWVILAAILTVVAIVFGVALYRDRAATDALERDRLQAQAKVVDENLARQLESVSRALAGARDELDLAADPATWSAASARLRLLNDAMPGVRTMAILDADGTVVASARPGLLGRNFRHRGYYAVPRAYADPAMLHVSAPIEAAPDGFVVFVSRAIVAPDGRFAGVIAATLNPDYFSVLVRSVVYAADMRATMIHGDGTVILGVPADARMLGMDLAVPGSAYQRHRAQAQPPWTFEGADVVTGERRLQTWLTVAPAALHMDKPLVVVLSRDASTVFRRWTEKAVRFGIFFAIIVGVACSGLLSSQRRRRAMEHADARLRSSEQRLSMALEGSGLALFDWDLAAGTIYHSAQVAAMRGHAAAEATSTPEALRAFVHPDDLPGMLARIRDVVTGAVGAYNAEFRIRQASGEWSWIRARGRVVERDDDGRALRLAGTYADIDERKRAEDRLRRQAEFDALTDLPNRMLFRDRLQQALRRVARTGPLALLYVDVDQFKTINDTLGHAAGDELLKIFAQRMQAAVRQSDTVARLSGDEFTIILEGLRGAADARELAGQIVEALRAPIALNGRFYRVTVSVGVAIQAAADGVDDDALLRRADAALYEAKRRGRDGYVLDGAPAQEDVVAAG